MFEAEELLENWKAFKDVKDTSNKQEQIKKMKKQYDKVQQVMKESSKGSSPFERLVRLFSKRNKQGDLPEFSIGSNILEEMSSSIPSQPSLRPMSSLSLQSTASKFDCYLLLSIGAMLIVLCRAGTSSSGRMSTLSGCSGVSFGDSGTHSDVDERKHLMRQPSNASDHEYFEISDKKRSPEANYQTPPPPKPVNNLKVMNFSNLTFTTINVSVIIIL